MTRRRKIEIDAQRRALAAQGARLAAERDWAFDGLEQYENALARAISMIANLRSELAQSHEELLRCRDVRHTLLVKLRAARQAAKSSEP